MSDLMGAWALHGRTVADLLSRQDQRAMLAQLPGFPDQIVQRHQGPLWLTASSGKLLENSDGCLAAEGYFPSGIQIFKSQLGSRDQGHGRRYPPDGHYVLATARHCGDPARNSLTLLRSLSGGERIYYVRCGDLILFSSSLRPLLAHPQVTPKLDPNKIQEALLTGLTLFGSGTLVAGIEEVLAGHALKIEGDRSQQRWQWGELLRPLEGDPACLARKYRDALAGSVELAIGDQRPVAVALSGGIDSAAVTALAVEAVGADNVHAFTYEFVDPSHGSETPFAREVCRRLGMVHHHIIKIHFGEFLAAIPETVWRSESLVHWPKAFMLPLSRRIMEHGFSQYLSGFGIGSHMGFFEALPQLLRWLPVPDLSLKIWKLAHHPRGRKLQCLERVHPGFARPNPRLYYLLLCLLRSCGIINDIKSFYPAVMGPLLASIPRTACADPDFATMQLTELLRHHSFAHLISCVDVTRWEKTLREIGIHRVLPAHFAGSLPYAYLPYNPPPFIWSADRQLRPGKHLLRLAMADTLPVSVLLRKKSWLDAVISPAWLNAGRRWMRQALGGSTANSTAFLGPRDAAYLNASEYWDERFSHAPITALGFWHRIFLDSPPHGRPPTWEDLL